MNKVGLRFAALATAVAAFSLTPIAGADDPVATDPAPVAVADTPAADPAPATDPVTDPAAADPAAASDPAPFEAPAPEPPALTSATTDSGYEVTLTGPVSAVVGEPTAYSATCGGGYPCPWGEFRAFGSIINRLGEGFGRGEAGTVTFRAPGLYSIRYRVGAACPGSPRLACPIDVWINTNVEPAADEPAPDAAAPDAAAVPAA